MFEYQFGPTPLDPDEANGLIPLHIKTQAQLNEWEQANILEAEKWVSRQRFKLSDIASLDFIKRLHQRMFNETWSWAGSYRKSDKNIGVDWQTVPVNLKQLIDDVQFQLQNETYPIDELVARFHHRLVWIHPFANGNGRHARLMADIVLMSQGCDRFSWGKAADLVSVSQVRDHYIAALRAADKKDYQPLLNFLKR